jgi:predicted CXXCH cytochrome family protein
MSPKFNRSWNKSALIFGGVALWGILLVGCVMVQRSVVAPPQIPGATYVGSQKCAECHEEQSSHFKGATHSRLALKDEKGHEIGCEACHGPGSLHVKVGGSKSTIINPRRSPEACFQCHLDKRAEFSLPNAHPVLAGNISCIDCHDVHRGDAVRGGAHDLAGANENCTKCHTEQRGPFVYEHAAMREGCTVCHNPHGSVNQKMLVARDANLCLRCHLDSAPGNGTINIGGFASGGDHNSRLMRGACWSAGCHEAPHGSNVNASLRY